MSPRMASLYANDKIGRMKKKLIAVYLSKWTMESVQNFSHASCLLSSKLTSTPDVQTKNISTFHPTG